MSKQPQYAVGTIVKLKSGGPDMTVKEPLLDYSTEEFLNSYTCQWFAGKKSEESRFPEDSLELVKLEAKSA